MAKNPCAILLAFFLLRNCQQTLVVDPHDLQDKPGSQVKRRLSLQNTAEIQSCMVSSAEVGCDTFQCFANNSCELEGLDHICLTLLHNAGSYDSQGKAFVKDTLRCMALGLRQRFSCLHRRCSAVSEMVHALQRECYSKHQLCLALQDHMDTVDSLVQFHLMFPPGPYVELVKFLLQCREDVRLWVTWRLREQCEQHWGTLCSTVGGACPLDQSETLQTTTVAPSLAALPPSAPGPLQQPMAEKSLMPSVEDEMEPGVPVSGKVTVSMS